MAERLQLSHWMLRRFCHQGRLGPESGAWIRPGRAMWFDRVAVEQLLGKVDAA